MMNAGTNIQTDQALKQAAEGLQFLYKNLTSVLPWNMALPVLLYFSFYESISVGSMLLWAIPFYVITVPRYWLSRYFSNHALPQNVRDLRLWELGVAVPSLLAGLVWGAITFILFDSGGLVQQVTILTIVFGICILSLVLAVYCLPAFYGFIIPSLLGESLYFFTIGREYWVIGVLSLILLAALIKIGQSANRQNQSKLQLETENLELIEKLTVQKERAELANYSKSKFLASAGHDLRQPVHSLTMFAEALRSEISTRTGRELVDHVDSSVAVLDNLLTALLEISRLEAGVVSARKVPINIEPLLKQVIDELRPVANEKQIQFRTRLRDAHVYTDPILLANIVRSLIRNAIEFTDSGGILVSIRRYGDRMLLQIWDTGSGISEDHKEQIFVEFFQIDNHERDRKKGLGLGLSISKKLCELLGFELNMRSELGKGSVFELELTRIPVEKVIPVSKDIPAPQMSLSGKRLLIIDNEESILQGTLSVLHRWHCVVDTASNTERALELLKQGCRYDAYLCDHQLGGTMNGIELLNAMAVIDGGNTPGILVTGNTDPEFIRSVMRTGYVLLHKPVKPAQLRALLAQKVQNRLQVEEVLS